MREARALEAYLQSIQALGRKKWWPGDGVSRRGRVWAKLELAAGESGIPGEVGVVAVVGGVEEGARDVVELWVRWI